MSAKSDKAFLTISEVSAELNVPQHILRYWETRFPQLRPLQRAGNRRYYRPEDVALARRIDGLLNREGYTVRGVQQLLAQKPAAVPQAPMADAIVPPADASTMPAAMQRAELMSLRALLAGALAAEA